MKRWECWIAGILYGLVGFLIGYQCGWNAHERYQSFTISDRRVVTDGNEITSSYPEALPQTVSVTVPITEIQYQAEKALLEEARQMALQYEPNSPIETWQEDPNRTTIDRGYPQLKIGYMPSHLDLLTIINDGNEVRLTWESGRLEIRGDPNHYSKAAESFLLYAVPGAAYELISADEKALRRLCESGRVCAVLGHIWQGMFSWEQVFETDPPPDRRRTCQVCGLTQTRRCVEGQWTEWQSMQRPQKAPEPR